MHSLDSLRSRVRHSAPAARSLALAAGLAVGACACEALTGLDQISEQACAPFCGDDDAGDAGLPGTGDAGGEGGHEEAGADATSPDGRPDAPADGSGPADSGTPVDPLADGSEDDDGGRNPDGGPPRDAGSDAASDARADAPAGADGGSAADSGVDAGAGDAGSCGTVYFSDSFDDDSKGWTLDSTWSIADTCSSPPAPQKGNPDPTVDHTRGVAGGVVAAYACGNNPAGTTAVARYVTSPVIDVSQAPEVFLTFYRWLNSDASTWMTSTVDVYDGTAWVSVYTNPAIVTDAAWTQVQYPVTMYKNAQFRVRFGYALVSSGVYAMSCWNVDDVTVSSSACH
jgi:hypothetical protein